VAGSEYEPIPVAFTVQKYQADVSACACNAQGAITIRRVTAAANTFRRSVIRHLSAVSSETQFTKARRRGAQAMRWTGVGQESESVFRDLCAFRTLNTS